MEDGEIVHKPGNSPPSLGIIAENSSQARNPGFCAAQDRRYKLLRTARKLLPGERIAQCQHNLAPNCERVDVMVNDVDEKATFKNLVRCDSPQCPFCSLARSENDRHELSVALAEAKRLGYYPLLLTFTLSHRTKDSLDSLRSALRTAFDKTFSGRWYQNWKQEWEIVGKVVGSEITYGKNGWHPHLHVLVFTSVDYLTEWTHVMQSEIAERWRAKVKTLGFSASVAHGVDVRTAESDIADYIAKWGHEPLERAWGADSEIAKANVKRAAHGGLTPFQLLGVATGIQQDCDAAMLALRTKDREALKKRCIALFCEFWYAYKGRARIHWGQMRKLLNLDVALEHYELNNHEEPPESWTIAMIQRGPEWNKIRGGKCDDLRAELLEVCASRDAWKVRAWLAKNGIAGRVPVSAFARSFELLSREVSNDDCNEARTGSSFVDDNLPIDTS